MIDVAHNQDHLWVAAASARAAGATDAAVALLESLVGGGAAPVAARLELGHAYMAVGRAPDAARICRDLLAADPGLAEAWSLLGQALGDGDDHAGAEAALRRATELRPDDATLWAGVGWARGRAGDWVGAFEAFWASFQRDRRNRAGWAFVGAAWANMMLGGEVIELFDDSVDFDDDDNPGYALRHALFLLAIGRREDAESRLHLRVGDDGRELWQRLCGRAVVC